MEKNIRRGSKKRKQEERKTNKRRGGRRGKRRRRRGINEAPITGREKTRDTSLALGSG